MEDAGRNNKKVDAAHQKLVREDGELSYDEKKLTGSVFVEYAVKLLGGDCFRLNTKGRMTLAKTVLSTFPSLIGNCAETQLVSYPIAYY